jgi:hypothetical protein
MSGESKKGTRDRRLELRASDEEKELFKRCAEHFAADGMTEPEVSDFVRHMAILYAIEHGIPLFAGDAPGSVGEIDDKRRLAQKKDKISEGMKRIRARKANPS